MKENSPTRCCKRIPTCIRRDYANSGGRSVSGVDKLESVARTALVGESTEGALDHLAKLIASAISTLPDSDYERVRMLKDGSSEHPHLI